MAKKSKKVKKRPHPMPKLGFADQCVYWTAMILTGGGSLAVMVLWIILSDRVAFADDRVVAAIGGRGQLNWFWLFLWLFLAFLIILAGPWQHRFPIFGRKDIKYGPPAYPWTYPLLMKNKPRHWVSPRVQANTKKARRIAIAAAALTLAFSLAMFPRSLYGRSVLLRDGTVTVYSPGNQETAHYKFSEITAVELDTHYHRRRKSCSGNWYVSMVVRFSDGTDFSFPSGSFSGDWEQTLRTMLEMKARYGGLVTIAGTEDLPELVYHQELTPEAEALLYELFE